MLTYCNLQLTDPCSIKKKAPSLRVQKLHHPLSERTCTPAGVNTCCKCDMHNMYVYMYLLCILVLDLSFEPITQYWNNNFSCASVVTETT